MPEFRVGSGYDIHRLVPGRPLVLACARIPFERGAEGHSDGDAAAHAAVDAILGAAALGDIGQAFPDTDPRYEGISSARLVEATAQRIDRQGWRVENLDLTLILEAPKLAPHVSRMRSALAAALGVDASTVSVKAKSNEGLGEVGRGEAVICHASVLLRRDSAASEPPALG